MNSMRKFDFPFKKDVFEKFIRIIGWDSLDDWIEFCVNNNLINSIKEINQNKFNNDWIWGVLFPLLSQSYKLCNSNKRRKIIGISALPGTGKSTLGLFVEKLSLKLNFKLTVISIDDFYLPNHEMELAVKNNPWNVSRGFPGSHSTLLLKEKLSNWQRTGKLSFPVFDKSINNGLGDRSHWKNESPDLVILEGWFLGLNPSSISQVNKSLEIEPPLSSSEIVYRLKIQNNLKDYIDIWNLVDFVWHLKAEKFSFLNLWKRQQEKEMFLKRGVSLSEENLVSFIRMLNVALPQNSFDKIKSDFLFIINQDRKLISLSLNN